MSLVPGTSYDMTGDVDACLHADVACLMMGTTPKDTARAQNEQAWTPSQRDVHGKSMFNVHVLYLHSSSRSHGKAIACEKWGSCCYFHVVNLEVWICGPKPHASSAPSTVHRPLAHLKSFSLASEPPRIHEPRAG